jgi:hypothetical protein
MYTSALSSHSLWAALRRRQRAYLASTLGVLPGSLIAGLLLERYVSGAASFVVPFALSMTIYVVTGIRLGKWRCPRCHLPFSVRSGAGRVFLIRERCVHDWSNERGNGSSIPD